MDSRIELEGWVHPSGGESWRKVLVFVETCFCSSKVFRAVQTYSGRTKVDRMVHACKFESISFSSMGVWVTPAYFQVSGVSWRRRESESSYRRCHAWYRNAMGMPITGIYSARSNVFFSSYRKPEALRVNCARPFPGTRSPVSDEPASWRFLLRTSELTWRILRSWILLWVQCIDVFRKNIEFIWWVAWHQAWRCRACIHLPRLLRLLESTIPTWLCSSRRKGKEKRGPNLLSWQICFVSISAAWAEISNASLCPCGGDSGYPMDP